jgi:hypothetical protein
MLDHTMPDHTMPEWIEQELRCQLAPVGAPEGLWNRIHEQRRPLRTPRFNPAWAIAAVSFMVLLAAFMTRQVRTPEFRSANPSEIRAWVRSQAGFDVPLPDQPPESGEPVSLMSARLDRRRGEAVAAISYRVGSDVVDMRVSPARTPTARHSRPRVESNATTRTVSWEMGAESYTVTLSGTAASAQACVLCHADPQALVAF